MKPNYKSLYCAGQVTSRSLSVWRQCPSYRKWLQTGAIRAELHRCDVNCGGAELRESSDYHMLGLTPPPQLPFTSRFDYSFSFPEVPAWLRTMMHDVKEMTQLPWHLTKANARAVIIPTRGLREKRFVTCGDSWRESPTGADGHLLPRTRNSFCPTYPFCERFGYSPESGGRFSLIKTCMPERYWSKCFLRTARSRSMKLLLKISRS